MSSVCRVCLADDIRLKTIVNTELQTIFEKLTSTQLITVEGRPEAVCYICYLLLKKFCQFIELSQNSEKFLTQLLQDGIELTDENLSRANKDTLFCTPYSLSVTNITCVTILKDVKDNDDSKVTIKIEPKEKKMVVIKNEHKDTIYDKNSEHTEKINLKEELTSSESENSTSAEIKQNQGINKYNKLITPEQQNKTKKTLVEDTTLIQIKKPAIKFKLDKKIPTLIKHPNYEAITTATKSESVSKNNKATYKCTKCPKIFRQKAYLKRHIRTHTGDKPYACNICNATFTDSVIRNQHKRTHSGEVPYVCHICSKPFNQKPHLKEHIRTHTGEKPHACDKCPYAFAHRSSLTRHMRIHTGEKPYICHKCSRSFIQISNLKKHIRSCQGDKIKTNKCIKCSHEII